MSPRVVDAEGDWLGGWAFAERQATHARQTFLYSLFFALFLQSIHVLGLHNFFTLVVPHSMPACNDSRDFPLSLITLGGLFDS